MATRGTVNPLVFERRGIGDVSDINPMRTAIVGADAIPGELRGALVIVVSTRVAPIVSSALAAGSPVGRVYRDSGGIAEALSRDASLGTEDLIGVRATPHSEFALGAVHGERRSLPGGGGNAALEGVFSEDTPPERRLATINAQLGGAGEDAAIRRAREVEAAMERL